MSLFNAENLLVDESVIRKEGGLMVKAFMAFHDDILTWPGFNAAATSFAQAGTATGAFAMKPGKKFVEIESDLEMGGLDGESQGDLNYLSAKNTYTFEQAGTSPSLVGFLNTSANRKTCIVVKDHAGNQRIIGAEGMPAKIVSFKEAGGVKTADKKSLMFQVYFPGMLPLFYTGTVPTTPAE